jgi:hypothetical protein
MGWLAIPNIAILIVTLQALGFLFVNIDPAWIERFALIPELVRRGEVWRLVTFLALPLSLSPIFVIFVLWFLYFILNTIENEWGSFKTTLYVLTSIIITIVYSFAFDVPVFQITYFESTLFLAAATLFPDMEIQLFLVIPVKIKWLAWLTVAFLLLEVYKMDWLARGYVLAIFSNYVIFFGPSLLYRLKNEARRRNYRRKIGR